MYGRDRSLETAPSDARTAHHLQAPSEPRSVLIVIYNEPCARLLRMLVSLQDVQALCQAMQRGS